MLIRSAKRMNTVSRRFLTCFAAFLLSFVVGVIGVAQNEWFGSGDLSPYAFYCIPFAVFLWGASSLFYRIVRAWPSWLVIPTAFILGAIAGFIGTYSVAIFLGPWFGAMSVPVLKSLCVSGSIFVPALYLFRKSGLNKLSLVGVAACSGFGVALFFGISPLWSLGTGNQHLTTAFFRHIPGEQELSITREPDWFTIEDRDLVLSSGLTGTLECFRSGGSNSTDWPRARAFVIFTAGLSETVRLAQPKHTTVLYVQREQEFEMIPKDAPTFERAIEFYRDGRGWSFWVEQASGAKSGGGLSLQNKRAEQGGGGNG